MEKLPTYRLTVTDDQEPAITFTAFVEDPAIQSNFMMFKDEQAFVKPEAGESKDDYLSRCIPVYINEGKEQDQAVAICISNYENKNSQQFADSYSDYPKQASENAKTALRWAEKNGWGDCGTDVGKARANQLANGEPISRETIARMAAFERHRQNSQKELGDGCGRLMWLAWGGDAGIEWAKRKLEQIDRERQRNSAKFSFAVQDEERRIITGPVMIPDQMIYRSDKNGQYYVYYTKADIEKVMKVWAKHGKHNAVNEDHNAKKQPEGVYLVESFMTDSNRGINAPSVFTEQFPDGTWFHSYYVENDEVWERAKKGEYKGFSVEGYFDLAFNRTHNVGQDIAEIMGILNKF